LEEYNRNGVKKTAAGDSVIPETRIYEAAAKFIQVLQMTAKSYDLPDSVMRHIEGMSSSGTIIQTEEGFEIPLYFEGDLHRDSLDNDLGYEGINNIVALFNNGYHAQNYVYGWWDNHSPSGAAIGHSLYNDNYAWVRSKKERDALKFIQQAISDFNGNYGSEYNITAVIAADIYEQ
jgi:hypothetical protein